MNIAAVGATILFSRQHFSIQSGVTIGIPASDALMTINVLALASPSATLVAVVSSGMIARVVRFGLKASYTLIFTRK
jgi:hypothetical protein